MSGTMLQDSMDCLCRCHIRPSESCDIHGNSGSSGDNDLNPEDTKFPQDVYQANTGNDKGFSTVGIGLGKFTNEEWAVNNARHHDQTLADIVKSKSNREDADNVMKSIVAEMKRNQIDSTTSIQVRLIDVNFWKSELEREIKDMLDETDCLLNRKKRLENALSSLEIARHIVTDNLHCRDRRYGVDRTEDSAERALLKELDLQCKVEKLWKKALESITIQIDRNREAKEQLETDWSNKKEADEYDTANAKLSNSNPNKQFYAGVANSTMPNQLSPEAWAQHSHDNIVAAEQERLASEQLRMTVDNMFDDNARDMQRASDTTQTAVQSNIDSLTDSKCKMEGLLKKNCNEITEMEKKLNDLHDAIRNLDDSTKVAQTRLHNRNFRPGADFCKDAAQDQLVDEITSMSKQMGILLFQVNRCENSLKDMFDTRENLEREIACKKNTIFIDKDKVLTHRYRYPSNARFRGFNHV